MYEWILGSAVADGFGSTAVVVGVIGLYLQLHCTCNGFRALRR